MDETKLIELLRGAVDALPEAQKEAFLSCKTVEDVVALAGKTGVALPDALMDAVAGGKMLGMYESFSQRHMPDQKKKFTF